MIRCTYTYQSITSNLKISQFFLWLNTHGVNTVFNIDRWIDNNGCLWCDIDINMQSKSISKGHDGGAIVIHADHAPTHLNQLSGLASNKLNTVCDRRYKSTGRFD